FRGARGRRGRFDRDLHAVGEIVLPVDDDAVAGRDAFREYGQSVLAGRDHDGDIVRHMVGRDRVDVVAVWTGHDASHRRGEGALAYADHEVNVDELAGPERLFLIRECRVEGDRAGRRRDLIVDESELAVVEFLSFLRVGLCVERALRLGVANFLKVALRN